MKKIFLLLTVFLFAHQSFGQDASYDKVLADSLGADEYGMKSYIFVILKTGSNTLEKKESIDSLFAGHMANIGRLAEEGKLIVAGPIKKMKKIIAAFLF